MEKMTDVEKRFLKSAKKAGMTVAVWKPSRKKCFYCGLGSPDFEVKGKPFHIECLPNTRSTGRDKVVPVS
jgi:hypothetical protein